MTEENAAAAEPAPDVEPIPAEELVVAPPPAEPLRPVASAERVELLDILRGMALFGILAANIRGFAGPAAAYFTPAKYWPAFHDRLAQAFVDTFIQGKFINIFAFLFGIGFAVQLERASSRSGKFGWTYARRLAVLLLFGLVHGLMIWWGDILLAYALIGFVSLLFRKRADKTVAIWSFVLILMPLVFASLFYVAALFGSSGAPPFPEATPQMLADITKTMTDGSWLDIQQQRMREVVTSNWNFLPLFGIQVLGLFLAGVYAWRKRFFFPTADTLPRYRRTMIAALLLGITWSVLITIVRWIAEPPMLPQAFSELMLWAVASFATPALSLGYICVVILLVHQPRWSRRLRVFAPLGRAALTNYLLQSVIGTLIFYNYGLGFFGQAGPALLLPLTLVIYAAQVVASKWWLERYRFGPVEWLWRRLTYPGPLPMRKAAGAPASQPAELTPAS
jgi:uncharacterized protein